MKKFLAIAMIAATFAACNNSSESKTSTDSTGVKSVDSGAVVTPPVTNPDTSKVKTDTLKIKTDSSKMKMEKKEDKKKGQ